MFSALFAGHTLEAWLIFHGIVFALLAIDLGLFHKGSSQKAPALSEAAVWSVFWVSIGVLFSTYVFYQGGRTQAIEYLTGYAVEKSLSIDNLFVFAIIFSIFKIQRVHQRKLLFWGILGAIVMRGLMIFVGAELLQEFVWLHYVFGAFLIYTGFKFFMRSESLDPQNNFIWKFLKKRIPFSEGANHNGKLFVKQGGKIFVTTAFAALLLIEFSDVLFALDSVPAVLGITRDPYLVYTSNVFAILGLRSLFFILESVLNRFHLLKTGLAVILVFVGLKMCLSPHYHLDPFLSLCVILGVLAVSILMSALTRPRVKNALKLEPHEKALSYKMFDEIASTYDLVNRVLSLGRDVAWRKSIAGYFPKKDSLKHLDLATGTGDQIFYVLEELGSKISKAEGLDLSVGMLEEGRIKVIQRKLQNQVSLEVGDACQIPRENNSFDAVTMSFGIRNVPDYKVCLKEIHRVLKPTGKGLVLEFSLPSNALLRWGYLFYFRHILPWLGGFISGSPSAYRYLNTSVEAFPYGDVFLNSMREAGFSEVRAHLYFGGVATLYEGVK